MKINKYLDFDMFGYRHFIVQKDLSEITSENLDFSFFDKKTILITGANGMIATYLIYTFMYLIINKSIDIKVIALSRTKETSIRLFHDFIDHPNFKLLIQDVCQPIMYDENIDFIFHLAGNASPFYIKNDPVGIMKTNIQGTFNLLDCLRNKNTKKVIFASTREVYGENKNIKLLTESNFGFIDPLDSRSCYPESKRAVESILKSYYVQYGMNFNTVRIAHSYGPGMKLANDGRILSDLLYFISRKENIVLKSTGEALRAFCYINDVITGLLYILIKGNNGEAYNLSNEKEEIRIRDLAELLINLSCDNLSIEYNIENNNTKFYCNYERIGLNNTKLVSLGWFPKVNLKEGLCRVLNSFS